MYIVLSTFRVQFVGRYDSQLVMQWQDAVSSLADYNEQNSFTMC